MTLYVKLLQLLGALYSTISAVSHKRDRWSYQRSYVANDAQPNNLDDVTFNSTEYLRMFKARSRSFCMYISPLLKLPSSGKALLYKKILDAR